MTGGVQTWSGRLPAVQERKGITMTLKDMRCKNCGAVLQDISTKEVQYCPYCGTPLYFDDEVTRTEQTINHTTTIRDEARLKEAENEAKRLDLKERRLGLEDLFILFIFLFTLGYVASPMDAISGNAIDDIIIIFIVLKLIKRLSRNL